MSVETLACCDSCGAKFDGPRDHCPVCHSHLWTGGIHDPPEKPDPQCARCGGSTTFVACDECEDGYVEYDFGDDVVPEIGWRQCDACDGTGGWLVCGNSPKWCDANPMPGRENVPRGGIEEERS